MKKFLINILFVFILAVIGNTAFAKDIKFIQIADAHYALNNDYSKEVLEKTVEKINKEKDVSFVIFTGDNINRPRQEDLISFVREANKLNVPYYLAFGDHDVYKSGGLSKLNYIEIVKDNNFLYKQKDVNYVIKKNGFVFLVVDGAKEVIPGSIGYYKDSTIEWVDQQLSKYKKKPVIILQHFPLVEPKEHKTHKVYKPEKYLEVLEKHNNVIAIVSGHYHINGEKMQNGIYHISSPSLMVEPHCYKVIDIVTSPGFSPMIYTELKPVDVK